MKIVFLAHKSVGKSTLLLSLCGELFRRGQRVLLIDADPQGTAAIWRDVRKEHGRAPLPDLLCGAGHLADPALGQGYDLVLIDTIGAGDQRAAALRADLILVPSSGQGCQVWHLDTTLKVLAAARREADRPLPAAFVLARRPGRARTPGQSSEARATLAGIGEAHGLSVLRTENRELAVFANAITAGSFPSEYDPASAGAMETARLLDEVLDELQPLALAQRNGVLSSAAQRSLA